MKKTHTFLAPFVLYFPYIVLASTCLQASPSSFHKREEEWLHMRKKRRQVFREDLSPLLGGKIPSGALEWTRLMFNNLDSRGISIPDGYLPSNDRIPPEGTRTEESRIRFFSNKMLVPYIDTTYTLRSPVVLASLTAMAAARSPANPNENREGEEERRGKIGIRVYTTTTTPEPKKKMEMGDSVGREQSRVIQDQKPPRTNLDEIHIFSPKQMERLEQDYRNRLIDEILSLMKSLHTTSIHLLPHPSASSSSSSSSQTTHTHTNSPTNLFTIHFNQDEKLSEKLRLLTFLPHPSNLESNSQ